MLNDYGYSRKNSKNQSERKSHSIHCLLPCRVFSNPIGGGGDHRINNQHNRQEVQCHISLA